MVSTVPTLRFVGSVATVDELLGWRELPEIVLLDLRLADGSSPATNVERLAGTGLRVLVLTSGEDPYLVRSVAMSEIHGLVRKSAPLEVLAEALRMVMENQLEFSTEWASAIDTDTRLDEARLTIREQQVLTLYARGRKGESVARELRISSDTVNDHVKSIRAKYSGIGRPAPDKVSLYQRAVQDGYLPAPTYYPLAGSVDAEDRRSG
ncbi:LuxR C-terminal-related transcriptional regulator [Brevibacterium sp.]|uniref:response regulator transcription factor n=1 Tax=Brevibacterium sp. TaxID=1701 RepID=UPI0028116C8E|nr:LuxR C-terminal-related transcriptional regulator [Brevibacterium sp.]